MKILQFSGGKDSLACLYLLKKEWDTLNVVWVNSGAAYEETMDYMKYWRARLPNFIEVTGNQPQQVSEEGWPADIVPINDTTFGRNFVESDRPKIQSYLNCCANNIWYPMMNFMQKAGVTHVVRGQRADDDRKSAIKNGDIIEGIKYDFPIYSWSDNHVFEFLKDEGAYIPEYYFKGEKTGRDCWDCTAYLEENKVRIDNLPANRRAIVCGRIEKIQDAIMGSALGSWNG
jgi:phosphoadenosine phosphosulfate reductase